MATKPKTPVEPDKFPPAKPAKAPKKPGKC